MRKHVYGPINSRRLGKSLGVDLIIPKVCPLDCIYCEARATTDLTMERREYVKINEVLEEIDQVLSEIPVPDYITFSGAGEPTLHSEIGVVIRHIKQHYPQYRICVLTNGMLLKDRTLQQELLPADLLIPSLDASNEEEFRKINRPAAEIGFQTFLSGMEEFTHLFSGKVFLELFIVPGVNDSDESISAFARIIKKLRVDKVQLNSLDRPGTEEDVEIASIHNAERFVRVLSETVPVEVIGSFRQQNVPDQTAESRLAGFLEQAPADLTAIKSYLGLSFFETDLVIKKMLFTGKAVQKQINGKIIFFKKEQA